MNLLTANAQSSNEPLKSCHKNQKIEKQISREWLSEKINGEEYR
jgi:hypothetical protein